MKYYIIIHETNYFGNADDDFICPCKR
jgi:hypothetical protein